MIRARTIPTVILVIVLFVTMSVIPSPSDTQANVAPVASGESYNFYPWVTADGSVYNPYVSISRNSGDSWDPSLALDSSGNPHIAWRDYSYGNGEILYTRWNGSDWVTADGSVYDPAVGNANVSRNSGDSWDPSLALDSSGNPHIAWLDGSYGSYEILYTRWNGSDWVTANGSVYDPVAGNANVSRNSGYSYDPSLALDSSGNPHIA